MAAEHPAGVHGSEREMRILLIREEFVALRRLTPLGEWREDLKHVIFSSRDSSREMRGGPDSFGLRPPIAVARFHVDLTSSGSADCT